MSATIGYLVGEFPKLSETFVSDEVKEHLRREVQVMVISLHRPPRQGGGWSNVAGVDLPVVYVYRLRGQLQRIERLCIALLALLRHWRVWRVVFRAGFGTYVDRVNTLCLAYRLGEIDRRGGIDLLHCHFGYRGHLAAALKSLGLLDARIVTTFHGVDMSAEIDRKGRDFYSLLFRFGDLFLPVSRMWADKLLALGCDPAKIAVHHVGIDCSRNEFRLRRPVLQAGAPVKLMSIGRLVEKKGHGYALQALARLRADRPELQIQFDVIGDGPLLGPLKELARDLDLIDVVTFHGGLPHDQTLALLDQAAIFVLPSVTAEDGDMEGIPVSLMEAMARGLLVVSTFHSGIPELVEDGVTGLLVPERDVAALAGAIERGIECADDWPDMLRAARKTIETKFDRQELGLRLIEHYQDVLTRQADQNHGRIERPAGATGRDDDIDKSAARLGGAAAWE